MCVFVFCCCSNDLISLNVINKVSSHLISSEMTSAVGSDLKLLHSVALVLNSNRGTLPPRAALCPDTACPEVGLEEPCGSESYSDPEEK